MNVLLVALDTVRADHLGCYGYRYATSPTLDRLAAEAVRFDQCHAPGIPTTPSYTTTFTGQHPITHGVVTHGGRVDLDESRPWLPALLARAGYVTGAVDSLASMKSWFNRGYRYYLDPTAGKAHSHDADCREVNERALGWLREHADDRFFLFVHYWDAHTPYLPPERYRGLFYEGDPCDPAKKGLLHGFYETSMHAAQWRTNWIDRLAPPGKELMDIEYLRAMYDAEIRLADDGLGELLAALADAGLADSTLVVVFADHGEEMYEHGVFFDHHGLYEGNLRVPLLVRWPREGRRGAVVRHLVQHTNIAPTVLEAVGLEPPPEMEGRSLAPYLRGTADAPAHDVLVAGECTYQRKHAILADGWKLIVSLDGGPDLHKRPPRELYDLRADGAESHNLAQQQPERVRELEQRMEGWIAATVAQHGLPGDPYRAQEITIGKGYRRWLEEHRYW